MKSALMVPLVLALGLAGCAKTPTLEPEWKESVFNTEGNEEQRSVTLDSFGKESKLKDYAELPAIGGKEAPAPDFSNAGENFSDQPSLTVAVENMPLNEFINYTLSDVLKVNFLIDPKVSDLSNKMITLNIKDQVSPKRFYQVLKDTLSSHDLAIVNRKDLFYVYQARNRGHYEKLRIGIGADERDVPAEAELVYQIVPLTYIDAGILQNFVTQVTLAAAKPFGNGDYVVVEGQKADVLRALKIINYLDVPASVGTNVVFMRMKYLEPELFIDEVSQLLKTEGINVDVSVKLTPLLRHNGVVIHTASREILDRVKFWKETLDTDEASGSKRYLLYFPENSKAGELADGLIQLLQLQSGGSGASNRGSSRSRSNNNSGGNRENVGGNSGNGSTAGGPPSGGGGGSSFSSDEISLVADDNRNALIFYTEPYRYQSILPIIKQLDVLPAQVLIEAKFIEVTLTDQFSNGVEWALTKGSYSTNTLGVGDLSGGFSYSLSGLDYNFVFNMLQQNDDVKVLSSPRVIVTDGSTASINVGTDVPILVTQSNDVDTDRVLQSVQYRSTGVNLQVEPTVNSRGIVSMKVNQSVTETSENSSGSLNSPLILNRSIATDVIAKSGQTVVLGGLIRENRSYSNDQVPGLGKIPLVGGLFSKASDSTTRTELILMVTPKILNNTSDLDEIKDVLLQEMVAF